MRLGPIAKNREPHDEAIRVRSHAEDRSPIHRRHRRHISTTTEHSIAMMCALYSHPDAHIWHWVPVFPIPGPAASSITAGPNARYRSRKQSTPRPKAIAWYPTFIWPFWSTHSRSTSATWVITPSLSCWEDMLWPRVLRLSYRLSKSWGGRLSAGATSLISLRQCACDRIHISARFPSRFIDSSQGAKDSCVNRGGVPG